VAPPAATVREVAPAAVVPASGSNEQVGLNQAGDNSQGGQGSPGNSANNVQGSNQQGPTNVGD